MIQPYFKPDTNPNMPAFATFYNGYYQERSKMNMQIMNIMLKQATPEYLTTLIDRTQSNIVELQKNKASIIKGNSKDGTRLAIEQAKLNYRISKTNAEFVFGQKEFMSKLVEPDKSQGRNDEKKKLEYEDDREAVRKILGNKDLNENLKQKKLTKKAVDIELAIELLDEDPTLYKGDGKWSDLKSTLEKDKEEGLRSENILKSTYPSIYGTPEKTMSPEDKEEYYGYNLIQGEKEYANNYLYKGNDGRYYLTDAVSNADNKETIKKQQRYLNITSTPSIGGTNLVGPSTTASLKLIDDALAKESEKLQGYLTRYDVSQTDIIEKMFSPFEDNYRTNNQFKRKSPKVLQQEQEIMDFQYRERTEIPSGYANLEYNTEYEAPGGLLFGLTKVGEQDLPYIFEGGTPYEIENNNPSYSHILELLELQDKKIGSQ